MEKGAEYFDGITTAAVRKLKNRHQFLIEGFTVNNDDGSRHTFFAHFIGNTSRKFRRDAIWYADKIRSLGKTHHVVMVFAGNDKKPEHHYVASNNQKLKAMRTFDTKVVIDFINAEKETKQ